jgi:hypothetical protein
MIKNGARAGLAVFHFQFLFNLSTILKLNQACVHGRNFSGRENHMLEFDTQKNLFYCCPFMAIAIRDVTVHYDVVCFH